MPATIRNPAELRQKVMARYGKPGTEVEQEYFALLAACRTPSPEVTENNLVPVGRRKKP